MTARKPRPKAITLAREFVKVLKEWLTPDEFKQVLERNRRQTNPNICHSHDFCDANMAMWDAGRRLGVRLNTEDYDDVKLWNIAWKLAPLGRPNKG